MKRQITIIGAAFAVALFAVVMSCDSEDKKTYDAEIEWQINNSTLCKALVEDEYGGGTFDFDQVTIKIWDDEKDIAAGKAPVFKREDIGCDEFNFTVEDMDRGNYYLELKAWADYDGEYLPYFKGNGELTVPSDEPTRVNLTRASGSVLVSWGFENYAMCGAVDVEEIQITLEAEGEAPIKPDRIPCDTGKYKIGDLDWNHYKLTVEGLNADEKVTHSGTYIAEESDNPDDGDAGDDAGTEDLNLLDVRPGSEREALVVLAEV
jgi:hypothetical protein